MDEDYYDDSPEFYGFDEGSDRDNYEDEQVFQDRAKADADADYRTDTEDDDYWEVDYPIHEDSSFLDLSRGCD